MGLFSRKIKNPIVGTAQIVRCSQPGNYRAIRARCDLFLVIEGPGVEPFSHEMHRQLEVVCWPSPGMTLPCRIDPKNLSRVEIDFDTLPNWREQARAEAEQLANQRALNDARTPQLVSHGSVTVVGAGSSEEAADAIRRAELATGMDLDRNGRVG